MSETYRFLFKYNGETVIDAKSNECNPFILEGGYSDWFEYNIYDNGEPTVTTSWVNSWAATPSALSQNFYRLSTELTLDDNGDGVWLIDEQSNIKIQFRLVHNGDIHTAYLQAFQKYVGVNGQGEDAWCPLWTIGQGTIYLSWDSNQGEEGYFAVYTSNVTDKTGIGSVPSVGFQLCKRVNGQFTGNSDTIFWEDNVFIPVYDYRGSYEPTTGNITIGGRGDGSYPSDPAERPDVDRLNLFFSFGSANGKGLTYYSVLVSDVYDVFAKIYGNSYINLETRLKSMIDFFRIPFVSTAGSNLTQIPVADVEITVTNGMAPIATRFTEVDFGVFDLSNYGWDDFNDFKNTRATLYLPFHGRVNIDINAIARGSIEVVAVCDTYTGNVVYWVYTTSMQAPREVLYGTYEGQSAVQIPIASTYTPNLMGKIAMGTGSVAMGIVGLGIQNPAMMMSGGLGAINAGTALQEQAVDRSHMQDSASSANSPLHIRLDIERREMLRTDLYRQYAGIPAFTTQKLKELEGFVRVHSADYNGLKCEQSEKEVIQSLMEEGIYL